MNIFSKLKGAKTPVIIKSPCRGSYIPMKDIPDEVFSQGILGPCCAIDPEDGRICAPCDGKIVQLADTLHAFCIDCDGVMVLVHLGIDTVGLKGEGFSVFVKENDKVKAGDAVIDMDLGTVRNAGMDPAVITVIANADELGEISFPGTEDCLIEVKRK
ncbi:MAG: PTS glucose transporter subunit IIA [Abditibacteriota bacterium]|nr:PTS glucose transporter subunit IIA [Abditibacteriota bacterium]